MTEPVVILVLILIPKSNIFLKKNRIVKLKVFNLLNFYTGRPEKFYFLKPVLL